MRGKSFCCLSLWVLAALLATGMASCSKKESSTTPTPKKAEKPAASPADSQAEVVAKLAKADALDGQTDNVVTRCASCVLRMDGKPEHSLKALDYTLHFCTENCAHEFGKDLTKSVLAMQVPGE